MIALNSYTFHYKRPNSEKVYIKHIYADTLEEAYDFFEEKVKDKSEVVKVDEHLSEGWYRMNGF